MAATTLPIDEGVAALKFIVTYPLTCHAYKERISRFLETGAQPPEGVKLHGRWVTASHSKGFMLVEAEDPKPLFRWTAEWSDLINFEIEPVLTDDEAAPILKELSARS